MTASKQKIVLVTGSNRGIGLAVVKGLAAQEHTVILTSRKPKDGERALQKLGNPTSVYYHQLDVNDSQSVKDLFQFTQQKFGKLDALINNAGINYDTYQNVENADLEDVTRTWETNTLAPWRMIQIFLPLLRKSSAARIVNVSSGAGSWADQNGSTPGYTVSKLALNGLTLAFAKRLASENILVNAVCPGWVRTDMGGANAPRSTEKGAETIIWAAQLSDDSINGKFLRDKKEIPW